MVKPRFFDTYLETILKSPGARIFQTFWADVDGKKEDLTEAGHRSCAVFVTGILQWFSLIREGHATVSSTLKDMETSGWQKITEPRPGCILHWEPKEIDGSVNEHIGFYIGDDKAISNDYETRAPAEHHWTYGKEDGQQSRKIVAMYWHPKLDNIYFP